WHFRYWKVTNGAGSCVRGSLRSSCCYGYCTRRRTGRVPQARPTDGSRAVGLFPVQRPGVGQSARHAILRASLSRGPLDSAWIVVSGGPVKRHQQRVVAGEANNHLLGQRGPPALLGNTGGGVVFLWDRLDRRAVTKCTASTCERQDTLLF